MFYRLHNNGRPTWATDIAFLLTKFGFQNVSTQQGVGNEDVFLEVLCLRLKNHFKSNWEDGIKNSSKLAIYSQFKCYLIPESYLEIMNIRKYLIAFSKFRCSNHQLAIEQGRHSEILMAGRICVLCNARNFVVKVKVFYSLISSLKTYYRTSHFTPWSLVLFIHVPFQLPEEHTVLQSFRRIELIVHIAISVLPGTHFHLSQVEHLRVKCLAQGHTILTTSQDWEWRNMIFLWKSCTKRDSKPHGRQRHQESVTL